MLLLLVSRRATVATMLMILTSSTAVILGCLCDESCDNCCTKKRLFFWLGIAATRQDVARFNPRMMTIAGAGDGRELVYRDALVASAKERRRKLENNQLVLNPEKATVVCLVRSKGTCC